MTEPLSDFSKILELQEVKKHYDDLQERVAMEMSDKDEEIARLKAQIAELSVSDTTGDGDTDGLREENQRLGQQVKTLRDEYESKIERLNARVRELSAAAGRPDDPPEGEQRRGFFRR